MRFARRPLALAAPALVLLLTAGTTLADPGHDLATPHDRAGPAWVEGASSIPLRPQWQVTHRWKPLMHFGLQGFGGEGGRWNDWPAAKEPPHRAGPALFGQLDLGRGGDEALLYQAAYLLGSVYRRQGDMFTVRLQYSF